jgi:hypothetical protein
MGFQDKEIIPRAWIFLVCSARQKGGSRGIPFLPCRIDANGGTEKNRPGGYRRGGGIAAGDGPDQLAARFSFRSFITL